MKRYLLKIILVLGINQSYGQYFLNGDFEITSSTGCDYNNTDASFNTKFSYVHAFGKSYTPLGYLGEIDIQTMGCFITPQSGNWCIGLASDSASVADAVALELNSNLVIGQSYQLSFYVWSNTYAISQLTNIKIGLSLNDSTFGNLVATVVPDTSIWKHFLVNFTSAWDYKYITVTNTTGVNSWNQIDNFSISIVADIDENIFENISIFPNPFSSFTEIRNNRMFNNCVLTLYNVFGQKVKQIEGISGESIYLQRDNLPTGNYFIHLTEGNNILASDVITILN